VVFRVNPNRLPLWGNVRLTNAPPLVRVRLDVGAHTTEWQLLLVETTTGRIKLPPALAFLDPSSNAPARATIDWRHDLDPDDRTYGSSNRKFRQIIAYWQLTQFLRELDASFHGGTTVTRPPTELVLRSPHVDADAAVVAARFGARIEVVPK